MFNLQTVNDMEGFNSTKGGFNGTILPKGSGGTGRDGHSPYIGQNGNWYEWDDATQQFVDTEVQAQGPQGNTGSSVEYPFELVNNLTTDDATKALSAKMGKTLKELINGIFVDVEEDGLFFVDNSFRIGAKIDSNGLHAINILEFEIQNL